ncbi:acetyl-CoA C-acetyltransferase [Microbacterium halotolerans]|uniref:acetyl-CoA C-acetyltransferase n=1 Tax=Microbacterium halotolerans TaxID=246613 RepID=UPI000E6AAA89|nr:acetyl-CoA C-acetyltransferase [Microbacterium halotolerans]
MTSGADVVLVAAARTAQGRFRGALASLSSTALGSAAIAGALARGGITAEAVDAVLMGQVLPAGAGQNPTRQASIGAGLGWDVPVQGVNKVCLSGLSAIIDATRMIRLGDATTVVAGGMESMTNAPHLLPHSRSGYAYGSVEVLDHLLHDALHDPYDDQVMGLATERHNERFGITRGDQDAVAVRSHERAAAATTSGRFDAEIAPVEIAQRKGGPIVVSQDEGIRPGTTLETLSGLRPAFAEGGTLTAGNSSQISDGAAAVALTTRTNADAQGWNVLATVGAYGQVAGPDNSLQAQPARATAAALERQGLSASDLDLIEINEAFGAVVAQSQRELGLPDDLVNPNGGGISLGHPVGASGARLVVTAAHELAARGGGTAAVALCGGGGQGDALILTR